MERQATMLNSMPDTKKTPIHHKILLILAMMSFMGGSLTAVMTYINAGYSDTFLSDWWWSFLAALTIMPIGFIMMGLMTKLVAKVIPKAHETLRNLLTGIIMAIIMESLMAFASAMSIIGFTDKSAFVIGWFNAFIAALPLGLTLIIIISMTVKPKIEQFLKS